MALRGIMRPPRPYRTAKRRWARVRAGVLERDGHRCRACGRASWPLEVDHVKRIASGGSAWAEMNLQTLCGRCHSIKTRGENRTDIPGASAWRVLVASITRGGNLNDEKEQAAG